MVGKKAGLRGKNMDQKKTLWIIVAVGVFLLAVLGAALFFYSPAKDSNKNTTNTVLTKSSVPVINENYSGWSNPPVNQNPPLQLPPQENQNQNYATDVQELVVFAENASVYDMSGNSSTEEENNSVTFDLNSFKQAQALEAYTANQTQNLPQLNQNINVSVNVPSNPDVKKEVTDFAETSPVSKTPEVAKEDIKTLEVEKKSESKKTSVQSSSSSAVKAKTASTTKKTSLSTVKTEVVSEPVAVTRYWVQVAAYSNKKMADEARSTLDKNKIPADVFTYEDGKGKLYYRVRVGPYTTKSESEYWNAKILQLKEFANAKSYITQTKN